MAEKKPKGLTPEEEEDRRKFVAELRRRHGIPDDVPILLTDLTAEDSDWIKQDRDDLDADEEPEGRK